MIKRKSFSPDFKREAARLLETAQKSSADLARELGVRRNQLYKWKEQLSQGGAGAFPGSGRGSERSVPNAYMKQDDPLTVPSSL